VVVGAMYCLVLLCSLNEFGSDWIGLDWIGLPAIHLENLRKC